MPEPMFIPDMTSDELRDELAAAEITVSVHGIPIKDLDREALKMEVFLLRAGRDRNETALALEDLPEGQWYIEARVGDTVARLLFEHKLLPLNGHHLGSPRVVVLTPRPIWRGLLLDVQGEALLVDDRPTYVDVVPFDVGDPIITTALTYGIEAGKAALTELLTPTAEDES